MRSTMIGSGVEVVGMGVGVCACVGVGVAVGSCIRKNRLSLE